MFRAPILTLAAVVVLGLVLIGVDMAVQRPAVSTAPVPASAPPPATAAAAPAPPPAEFPAQARYVGDVIAQGTTIPIAVTVDGGHAKAYVCDGHQVEAWLQGTATADALDASGRRGNHLTGHLEGDRLAGTVHLAGLPDAPFTAAPTSGTRTGIYRQTAAGRTTGWIVRDDGQVGLSHDGGGALAPAPPLPAEGPLPAGVGPVDGSTDVLSAP